MQAPLLLPLLLTLLLASTSHGCILVRSEILEVRIPEGGNECIVSVPKVNYHCSNIGGTTCRSKTLSEAHYNRNTGMYGSDRRQWKTYQDFCVPSEVTSKRGTHTYDGYSSGCNNLVPGAILDYRYNNISSCICKNNGFFSS